MAKHSKRSQRKSRSRKSRRSGRKSRRSGRKSRRSGRKSRRSGRKSRRSGRKSRRSGRKSRRSGRKSRRSGRKSRRSSRKFDSGFKCKNVKRSRTDKKEDLIKELRSYVNCVEKKTGINQDMSLNRLRGESVSDIKRHLSFYRKEY
jgi:hypothetical protein